VWGISEGRGVDREPERRSSLIETVNSMHCHFIPPRLGKGSTVHYFKASYRQGQPPVASRSVMRNQVGRRASNSCGPRKEGLCILTDIHEPLQAERAGVRARIFSRSGFLCTATESCLIARTHRSHGKHQEGSVRLSVRHPQRARRWRPSTGNNNYVIRNAARSFGSITPGVTCARLEIMRDSDGRLISTPRTAFRFPGGEGKTSGGRRGPALFRR